MSDAAEGEALIELLVAIDEVMQGVAQAKRLLGELPQTPSDYVDMTEHRQVAARALIKSFEQGQDLIARTFRATLIYEQVEITGLSPRGLADQAERLGLIESSDRWSDLVRLRNQLVHEYPLPRAAQLGRLNDAWHATIELNAIAAGVAAYLTKLKLGRRNDEQ